MKSKLASWLYLQLPRRQKEEVDRFLGGAERKNLGKFVRAPDAREINGALRALHTLKVQKRARTFWRYYFVLHLIVAILFFARDSVDAALLALFYAFMGAWILSRSNDNYWKMQFILPEFRHIALLFLSFPMLLLSVGSLSLDAYPLRPDLSEFILAAISAPLFEEIFFRDFLYRPLRQSVGFFAALALSSAAFAIAHMIHLTDYIALPVYFLAGILLGVLRELSGRLLLPIVLHISVNTALLFL